MNYCVVAETTKAVQELIALAREQNADSIRAFTFDGSAAPDLVHSGVDQLICLNLAPGAPKEAAAQAIIGEVKKQDNVVVLFAASKRLVNLSAFVAHALETTPIVDVSAVADHTAVNGLYGGKVIRYSRSRSNYAVYVCRSGLCDVKPTDASPAEMITIDVPAPANMKIRSLSPKEAASVDLTAAKTVVCVGRGVDTRSGFEACAELARKIGGELVCTRPVTETEDPFMPRSSYVGMSGLMIKPNLYLGVAVSGQQQHTAGMYKSGKVVVINSDKNALFFHDCDYGIVGDYQEIVPAILEALDQ